MNLTPPRFWQVALLIALGFGLLSAAPYLLHSLDPRFEGLTVIRDKDFGNYFSRLERALEGFLSEAANGITPVGSGIEGVQVAGMEKVVGVLFGWTHIPAPSLSVGLTIIFTAALFLLFVLLFRLLEFSERRSLGMATVYFLLLFHVVSRVVHPGWSFVPAIGALLAFFAYSRHPTFLRALITGVLLGILPYLYFWSFTYVWAVAGSFLLISFFFRRAQPSLLLGRPLLLAVLGAITLLVAVSFFLQTVHLMGNPQYGAVTLRGGFLYQRTVESLPRSFFLLVQTGLFLSLAPRERGRWPYLAILAMLLGILLAMHQNLFHGILLMFSSHYYPHLVLSSLAAAGYILTRPTPLLRRLGIAAITLLFLAGAAKDYLPGYRFFLPRAEDFRDQHLLRPIQILRTNSSADVVLTDAHTGRVLTAWTSEGIVYTTHMRFLLISDEEMAERYCLSELFSPDMPETRRTLYMEYNAVLDSPAMRERERQLVTEACGRVRGDPAPFLRRYGVTHILWNGDRRPEWNIARYSLPLRVIEASEDWLLLALEPKETISAPVEEP